MADVRFSICCRRSVIENVFRTSLSLFDTLLEDIIVIPEFLHFFFSSDKIHVGGDFLIHTDFPFCFRSAAAMCQLRDTLSLGAERSGT